MDLDLHSIVTFLLGVVVTLLGWGLRELWEAVKALRADVHALEVDMKEDYVRYDRMQDVVAPIMKALDEIRAKLDHKADKL
jgi:hypothetical protein